MNSKLLKVCAAVMLIASAESVLCVDGEAKPRFTPVSSEAKLEAKVKALVLVEFNENQETFSLVKDDGEAETDEDKLTFKFKVNTIAVGYGLKFETTGNLGEGDNGLVLRDDNGNELPILVTLRDGADRPVAFRLDETVRLNRDHNAGEWKLQFATELKDDTVQGTYSGGVKITLVARE